MASAPGSAEKAARTTARRARDCGIVRDPAVWLWAVVAILALLPLGAALV